MTQKRKIQISRKSFIELLDYLKNHQHQWLVTGAAGFIGSNLCHKLLQLNQKVIGLDNLSTGLEKNIEEIERSKNSNWKFIKADIRDTELFAVHLQKTDFVLHQAAVGSVPRSIKEPLVSHGSNVDGFVKLLDAVKTTKVKKFVYASSSSVYGDEPNLPKVEDRVGNPLSPYAVTKKINEIYAAIYHRCYQTPVVGLRYFNVFGPRQDPGGPYAAVIPIWIKAAILNEPLSINGDGTFSRDFCFIDNVMQANLLAALSDKICDGQVYNIAFGDRTTLSELAKMIISRTTQLQEKKCLSQIVHRVPREGDIPHSHANVDHARKDLNYSPQVSVEQGLETTIRFHLEMMKG